MTFFEPGTIVDLAERETLVLPDIAGATLRVNRGTLWITQEHDTRDVVLRRVTCGRWIATATRSSRRRARRR